MILRRVIAHFRKQEWTAIGIDLAIVVLGVYIGMEVQDWNGRRADREREVQIIGDLLADLEIDRRDYANGLERNLRGLSATRASFEGAGLAPLVFEWTSDMTRGVDYSFDPSTLPEFPPAQRDRMWTGVVIRSFPAPSTSTYDAIVGAGDFRIMRDREIVRAIQAYRNRAVTVGMQNEKLLSIRENAMRVGAGFGLAPYMEMPAEEYFRLLAREPGLAATVRVLATFTIFHYGEIKDADAHAARLQDRLRGYLQASG